MHTGKKLAVETGVDGTPVAAAVWVDAHEKTLVEDRTKSAECNEKSSTQIFARKMIAGADGVFTQNQNIGDRMEGKIAHEGIERQEEIRNSKKNCVTEWMSDSKMKVPGNLCRMFGCVGVFVSVGVCRCVGVCFFTNCDNL